jgi:hypothetical protein
MRHKTASDSKAKPDERSLDSTEELIRVRAYQLYEERRCEGGHDLDDWLRAEAEITGKKLATAADAEATEDGITAAVA